MKSKKANILYRSLFYLVFALIFSGLIFLSIDRVGRGASYYEQRYSKQIALFIDKAEPGDEIELPIFKLYEVAKKNHYKGDIVKINNDENKVVVKLADGEGYEFYFFNKVDVAYELKRGDLRDANILYMKVAEKTFGGERNV